MARSASRPFGFLLVVAGIVILGLAGLRVASAAPSAAAVGIVDFAFQPASTSIKTGESVTWTNNGAAPHTATADGGGFDTGIMNSGGAGSASFATAGTFAYHCAVHPEMAGTITVSGAPVELPETGDPVSDALPIALLAVAGAALLGGGAFVAARTR